jgi:sec-independent protein translocase protein TatB
MFDIDTGKLLIVAVVALIVIGPKDLPRVLRQVGQSVGKLRRMAAEFQGQFMDAIKDAEIEDIRKELKDLEKTATADYDFNPLRDIQSEVTSAVNAVTVADVGTASPVSDFTLPAVPAIGDDEPTLLAEGIAPALEQPETLAELQPAPGSASGVDEEPRPKRKLFIKPHRSRFARLNSDRTVQLTGQAISMRQRIVRARAPLPHDVVNS